MKFCLTLAKAKYTYSRYQILRLFPPVCHCSQYSWHMAISTVQQENQIQRSAKFLFPGCVYFCLALPWWCFAKQKNFLAAPCSCYLQWNVQFHLETGFLKERQYHVDSRLKMQFQCRPRPPFATDSTNWPDGVLHYWEGYFNFLPSVENQLFPNIC